jgi:hypothetical protein
MTLDKIKECFAGSLTEFTRGCKNLAQYMEEKKTPLLTVAKHLQIPVARVEVLWRVGKGEVLPMLAFHTCPGYRKLMKFPRTQQIQLLHTRVVVYHPDTKDRLGTPIDQLTYAEANRVFDGPRIRTVAEQKTHEDSLQEAWTSRLPEKATFVADGVTLPKGTYTRQQLLAMARRLAPSPSS